MDFVNKKVEYPIYEMENKIHVGNHQPDDVSNDLPEMSGSITHTHHIPKVLPRRKTRLGYGALVFSRCARRT